MLNVLLITADQWRGDCLSALGHPCVRTPHLDRLAGSGVLFTRHYSQASPCSPGRASLYTGLYLHNHRVVVNDALDEPLTPVPGDIPSPLERPAGCVFHTRCPEVMQGRCAAEVPVAMEVGEGHRASCLLLEPAGETAPR